MAPLLKQTISESSSCCVCVDHPRIIMQGNTILTCQKCKIQVHQYCYGIKDARDRFFCQKCQENNPSEIRCLFCFDAGGAFKKAKNGKWIHIICALYLPNINFDNIEMMDGINIMPVHKETGVQCELCDHSPSTDISIGYRLIECFHKKCQRKLHVTCAQRANLLYECFGTDQTAFVALCSVHHPTSSVVSRIPIDSVTNSSGDNSLIPPPKRFKEESTSSSSSSISSSSSLLSSSSTSTSSSSTSSLVKKERKLEEPSVSKNERDLSQLLHDFVSKESQVLEQFLMVKMQNNMDSLVDLTPQIEELSETNQSLFQQIKELEDQKSKLEASTEKLQVKKSNLTNRLDQSKMLSDRISTGLLLIFNLLKPETVSSIPCSEVEDFGKIVAEALRAAVKNGETKQMEKHSLLQKVLSDALKEHKKNVADTNNPSASSASP